MDSESGAGSEDEVSLPSRCASVNLYSCTFTGCNKTFSRPSRLDTHLLSHTGERPFKCDLCDKDFTRNAHLKRHRQINHEGVKPVNEEAICDHCHEKFANKYSLKKHIKKKHEAKQYYCDVCNKHFHKNHLLRDHKLEHTGDKFPHKCGQCNKQFKYPGQLKRHERVHKGYLCDVCNLTFEKWSDVQQHKTSEHLENRSTDGSLFKCEVCDKKFRSTAFLKRHASIHSEMRDTFHCPFEFCPRWFYFKSNLSQHIRSFHEGKKYLCSQSGCQSKFTSKQKLLDHLKSHFENKEKKTRKPQKKRKDKGTFKTPMASILTGVECAGAKSLLGDETRPMDSIEKISREVAEFIDNTSEATDASDSEPFVGCRRGPGPGAEQVAGSSGGLDPGLILANLRRLEPGKHFGSRGPPPPHEDTDLSSDTDCDKQPPGLLQAAPTQHYDFSKFVRK